MIQIQRFDREGTASWNSFIKASKNGFFLFEREYMDYHADRFKDHSLLFFQNDELLAVMPASEKEGILSSHAGLTYGGLILHPRAGAAFVLAAFSELIAYMKAAGFQSLVYKCIPYIFHRQPAGEDLYALFRNGAQLFRRDISSVISLEIKPSYTKGTKYNLSKARKQGVRIEESLDFGRFMAIEEEILRTKYGTRPTHTAEEITRLATAFPDNMKLYLAFREESCLGGTITFQTPAVIHTQYIGITNEGKEIGALDTVTDFLLQKYSPTHRYFSFGISTVEEGRVLNEGLIRNKESFGARAVVHDFYKIDITS